MKVAIYLRSGALFRFEAKSITVQTSAMTGELVALEWDGAGSGRPMFLRMEDVSAVVTERENADSVEDGGEAMDKLGRAIGE